MTLINTFRIVKGLIRTKVTLRSRCSGAKQAKRHNLTTRSMQKKHLNLKIGNIIKMKKWNCHHFLYDRRHYDVKELDQPQIAIKFRYGVLLAFD